MEIDGVRTDRLGLLLDQFDKAREMAQVRLTGLGDEEFLWEPAPDCWSIRRRAEATTPGFSQYPYGSAPDEPFISVLWGSNLEFIHHMAEIALLRDLWTADPAGMR